MAEQPHVLIVHNERQVREVLHQIFAASGYNCLLADDGRAGLKAFRESRPSLIVTDLNLPLMSGIELLQLVRQEDPNAAVIIGSDPPHRETATECLQLGADAYIIMNPLNVDEHRPLPSARCVPVRNTRPYAGKIRPAYLGTEF